MTNQISSRFPETVIVRVRGQAVIFDADLAALYGVTTKRLNEPTIASLKTLHFN